MTPIDISNARVAALDAMGLFYCNELPWRCSNPRCRDCSTAVADICNASGAGINPCGNSFSQAEWCHDAARPDWLEEMCPGLPGSFITYELAQKYSGPSFRGSNWGRNVDDEGDGHVEWRLGKGKLTWGAHSHATGVGYDSDGLDTHQLSVHAIPPHFLPWLKPAPPIDWAGLHKLIEWQDRLRGPRVLNTHGKRVTGPLHRGDTGPDVLLLAQILKSKGYMRGATPKTTYGIWLTRVVAEFKRRNGYPKAQIIGKEFGYPASKALLK